MSVASTLDAIHGAVADRRYDVALAGIRECLHDTPEALRDAKTWTGFLNSFDWFESLDESEQYLAYATAIATDVADEVAAMSDKAGAAALAEAFLNGVQFRLTAHSNGDPRPLMRARAAIRRTVPGFFGAAGTYLWRPRLGAAAEACYPFQTPCAGSGNDIGFTVLRGCSSAGH